MVPFDSPRRDRSPLAPILLAVAVAGALLASSCATNPVSGRRELALMSEQQEVATGREMDPQVRQEMGLYDDPAWQEYVGRLGAQLARESHRTALPWTFAVVDTPVVNAFALPGGYIYVTRGLLAHLEDEAELAGVLGHEIGHVTARHAVQQYSRSAGANVGLTLLSVFVPDARPYTKAAGAGIGALFLKYGRDDELQADKLGAEYAARSGWDPQGIGDMLQTLGRLDASATDRKGIPNWLASHPDPTTRVERIRPVVEGLRAQVATSTVRVERDAYLRRLEGLVYGENPREGVVRGNTFIHPELRIALEFPRGWRIANGKTQVVAQPESQQAVMVLDLVQATAPTLEGSARAAMEKAGFRLLNGGPLGSGDLGAFVGTFEGESAQSGRLLVRAAFFARDRSIFRVAGLSTAANFERAVAEVGESIRTFRTVSQAEADALQPARVYLHAVRGGETWARLAQANGNAVTAAELAVLNGRAAGQEPAAGDIVKLVRVR